MACPDCVTQKAISVLPDDMTMMTDCQEREERGGKESATMGWQWRRGRGLNSAFCHFQSGCQEQRNWPVAKAGLRECRWTMVRIGVWEKWQWRVIEEALCVVINPAETETLGPIGGWCYETSTSDVLWSGQHGWEGARVILLKIKRGVRVGLVRKKKKSPKLIEFQSENCLPNAVEIDGSRSYKVHLIRNKTCIPSIKHLTLKLTVRFHYFPHFRRRTTQSRLQSSVSKLMQIISKHSHLG